MSEALVRPEQINFPPKILEILRKRIDDLWKSELTGVGCSRNGVLIRGISYQLLQPGEKIKISKGTQPYIIGIPLDASEEEIIFVLHYVLTVAHLSTGATPFEVESDFATGVDRSNVRCNDIFFNIVKTAIRQAIDDWSARAPIGAMLQGGSSG